MPYWNLIELILALFRNDIQKIKGPLDAHLITIVWSFKEDLIVFLNPFNCSYSDQHFKSHLAFYFQIFP